MVISAGVNYWQISKRLSSFFTPGKLLFITSVIAEASLKSVGFSARSRCEKSPLSSPS